MLLPEALRPLDAGAPAGAQLERMLLPKALRPPDAGILDAGDSLYNSLATQLRGF